MGDAVEAAPATRTTNKYDLTRTISKYLDLHMMFPLLDFVEMSNIYPADQVAQARLDLLDATNMVGVFAPSTCTHIIEEGGKRGRCGVCCRRSAIVAWDDA